jgi:5-methylthioribose kinase
VLQFNLDTPLADLTLWLQSKKWLSPNERVEQLEKPGEGNMNVVLRLRTNRRSLILKQSRPYVNKYQDIPAPLERIAVEREFYTEISAAGVDAMVPAILAYAPDEYLLLLEDLGEGRDLTSYYQKRVVPTSDLTGLLDFLRKVHQQPVDQYPDNLALRKLNHQHIFVLPYLEENGFQLDDIQEGLQEVSRTYKTDQILKAEIARLGEQYLSQGQTLLHGDYYPGSWLRSDGQLYVIDPEFSFLGFPEFDLGVMVAHLILTTGEESWLATCQSVYGLPLQEKRVQQIAGTEVMRRLIGLAQLPLERSLEEKVQLLKMARKMIVG